MVMKILMLILCLSIPSITVATANANGNYPCGRSGIFTNKNTSSITIDSNSFHHIGRLPGGDPEPIKTRNHDYAHDHGIYTNTKNSVIKNNIFYKLEAGYGIQVSPGVADNTIINNTFIGSNPGRDGGIMMWKGSNVIIQNNIFSEFREYGIRCGANATSIYLYNNLSDKLVAEPGTNELLWGELIGCGDNDILGRSKNLENQPINFVDSSSNDYRLKDSSPAISAGLVTNAPAYDYNQMVRPVGKNPDIGAYELQGGTTYYVSANGGLDSYAGTEAKPFKTIQKAADVVKPGDTVIVKDGTFTDTNKDRYIVRLRRGGEEGKLITFKSENKWGAVLDGQNTDPDRSTWKIGSSCFLLSGLVASYVKIEGFEIKNCKDKTIANQNITPGSNPPNIPQNLIIYNNKLHASSASAIILGQSNNTVIDSNLIYDFGYWGSLEGSGSGIYAAGNNLIIKNNIIFDVRDNNGSHIQSKPIKFDGIWQSNNNWVISNNVFYGGDLSTNNGGILLYKTNTGHVIKDNIFYSTKHAIGCYGGINYSNLTLQNNYILSGTSMFRAGYCDPSEFTLINNMENQSQLPECADSTDNDYDGRIDFPSDPNCFSFLGNNEEASGIAPKLIRMVEKK